MTNIENKKIILQVIPEMDMGGAEIGALEIPLCAQLQD